MSKYIYTFSFLFTSEKNQIFNILPVQTLFFFWSVAMAVYSMREESERHSFENVKLERSVDAEDDADEVEDLSMSRKSEKVSPPPSPVSVASAPNSDTAVPAAQTGVIVPPQK